VWCVVCQACFLQARDLFPIVHAVAAGEYYLIADTNNHRIQLCPADSPGSGCETVAGTSGSAGSSATQLNFPYTVVLDGAGDYVISDHHNDRIQKCPASSPGSACETVAGTSGSPGNSATQLYRPTSVELDAAGDYVIADLLNHRIQKCPAGSPGSDCETVASTNQRTSRWTAKATT
jgi:hypothetical protein